ncbi:MAG: NAD-dependent epimerase/dehydratase family protein [Limisphaerales bacterium]
MKRIVIAGGSGFIGQAITRELLKRDYEVVILTRLPRSRQDAAKEIVWDGEHLHEWIQSLDGAEAVINLAGRTVHCRHTPENLRQIKESRVNSVRAIAAACDHVKKSPRIWVQASGIGFYGDRGNEICDEGCGTGNNLLAEVCRLWEEAFNAAHLSQTRRVILRIGVVLGNGGGGFPILARLAKLFIGGAAGNGKQFIGWIHLEDLVQMFIAAIENENLSGVFKRRHAETFDECRIHARIASHITPPLESAHAGICGKDWRAVHEN